MGGVDYDSSSPAFQKSDDKDEISRQFDRSITVVRNYTRRIERDYVQPLLKICYAYSQRRPISAVFIGIFAFLSFFPVISFIGISVFTTIILTTYLFASI
ncbi:hypothetical protein BJ912DRAFT_207900 [Pholiota molesta]|nr:hypothetical protein BJ912DRAFT_207900 [Pholiota molesta]